MPYGETPDNVRNHPALKGLNIPNTGQFGSVGLLVTKTLVILGDSQITTTPSHPRGAMLRAYDKATGKEVGAVWMPAPQSGSPMTYTVAASSTSSSPSAAVLTRASILRSASRRRIDGGRQGHKNLVAFPCLSACGAGPSRLIPQPGRS